jgi:predicted O-methyltransferase YrrM
MNIKDDDIKFAKTICEKYHRKVSGSIWLEEWAYLYRLIIDHNIKSVLEIGSFHHLSSTAFLQGLKDNGSNGHLMSIDINYPEPEFEFEGNTPIWTKLQMSSFDVLPSLISGFDLIFVDGEHSYNAASTDINNAKNIVNKDGFIIVHDSNYGPVKRAINDNLGNCEIWSHHKDKFHGIAMKKY